MIILDKPYVSDLLKQTLIKNQFPLINTESLSNFRLSNEINFVQPKQAVKTLLLQENPKVYSNSENAIDWVSKNLTTTKLPQYINLFKDKVKFRTLVRDMYPNFFFKEIPYVNLEKTDISSFPKPFILKPSIGFFSMGVYKIDNQTDWDNMLKRVDIEMGEVRNLYPKEVMDSTNFIAEELIEGDEFAFDAYFNEHGKPVVLGILKHLFSSGNDVSDRIYYTSKNIIEENLAKFNQFMQEVGKRANIKNFPVHIEVRVTAKGEVIPIEVNPMRFGGWCTTADLTTHAFGLNPYEYYFENRTPNWTELLQGKEGKHFCVVILDNSTGIAASEIKDFDYEKVLKRFNKPIDLRKVNWLEYPLFGILFTETNENNYAEIEAILKSDLKEFVIV
ncbi:MAG: ATP-grasp domain-containing protein [Salinivirgaceae bacterium]|nr:ATP-grasp domain-containing protein [Salinivirgaceae bacterium]MDY0281633.1 ATP-grasp domain-containing protein [Salinivirgaceae bacterium]